MILATRLGRSIRTVAIADAAAGEWPKRGRSAARALSNTDEGEDQSIGVKLLADIQTVFADRIDERITSPDLAAALHAMEDRPWPAYGRAQKPISVHQVARLLKPFGIAPRKMRIGDESVRGYPIASFNDAFTRYLPSQVAHSEQTAESRGLQPDSRSEQNDKCSDLENTRNPQGTAICSERATWNGESGDARTVEADSEPSAPVSDDDDIEREAIMNEADFGADAPAPKTAWDI